jgi:hypothetical protein
MRLRAAVLQSRALVQARRSGANPKFGGHRMLWFGVGIVYVVLLITLGIMTIRKGHVRRRDLLPVVLAHRCVDAADAGRVRTRLTIRGSVGGRTSGRLP